MTDITKCANPHDCKHASLCWRALAPAGDVWQSYSNFYKHGELCEHYWPVKSVDVEIMPKRVRE